MVERMDRFAEAIGHALTGKVPGEGSVRCSRCNSQVEVRNLMVVDWQQRVGPTCPNCGAKVDLASNASQSEVEAPTPVLPGTEMRCAHCGGSYQSMGVDVRSGEMRPTRFCPHCGHAVSQTGPPQSP